MKRLLMIAACLGLANLASAQLALEDFESGTFPPAGWTVVDNVGNGDVWQTSSFYSHGNLAGTGEAAAVDSDDIGSGNNLDSELITPAFDIPAGSYALEYDHFFNNLTTDYADVDLSVNGGPWINLKAYAADHSGHEVLDLSAYAGSTNCQVRFHYNDTGVWAWYWHVDNVEVLPFVPPPPPIWIEDFDGGTWPPAGWTIVDNIGNGMVWDSSSAFSHGNLAGTGEAAAIDSDDFGSGATIDTELITPPFTVTALGQTLEFNHLFNNLTSDTASVDISVGGGAWTNLLLFTADDAGSIAIDMDPYVGSSVQIRFHYEDFGVWAWYWHVDDVGLYGSSGPGVGYCFGDGSGTPCPCANNSDGSVPGAGCANGAFASGAMLSGSGIASISADSLVLSAIGLDPNNSGLYFQADNDLSPGNVWGDGLRCAGGQLKRLGVVFSDGTGASDTSGYTLPISVKAGNVMAGDTKYYQLWYRDTSGGQPCGGGVNDFNASNGYRIVWGA